MRFVKSVGIEGTSVVVEMTNGERVREHSVSAILAADMWLRDCGKVWVDIDEGVIRATVEGKGLSAPRSG